jgi:hypothetical protein
VKRKRKEQTNNNTRKMKRDGVEGESKKPVLMISGVEPRVDSLESTAGTQ